MPIHDWTRVSAGTFHAFHLSWISEIQLVLNGGLLPADYYAQAEQIIGPLGPDVLTLQHSEQLYEDADPSDASSFDIDPATGVAVATAPPRARFVAEVEMDDYATKRRTIVIRHSSDDQIIALLEIVSPGNKSSQHALRSFVDKAVECLQRGFHLLVIDLFPPGRRDPQGIHNEIWSEVGGKPFDYPADENLTLAAYSAGHPKKCFVEPTAIGRELIDRPLFLNQIQYVNVPLEKTYNAAYRGVPKRWRDVVEK